MLRRQPNSATESRLCMTVIRTAVFFLCSLLCAAFPANAAEGGLPGAAGGIRWQPLEPGLELARVPVVYTPAPSLLSPEATDSDPSAEPFPAPSPVTTTATVLRIDPEQFSFSLYMASESGPKTLAEIAESENFVAAINAGMYQRDLSTSTGHLRSRTHTNNPRVAANFGAFFVAGPLDGKPPHARLLDRNTDDWQTAITRYGMVMQNYRMTAPGGRVIWKQAGRNHSIAALSQDTAGRVLFILCSEPVSAADFVAALLRQPLDAGLVMYLEGGSEAALLVNAGGVNIVEAGRHVSGFWSGSTSLMLPNVLGIRRKEQDAVNFQTKMP